MIAFAVGRLAGLDQGVVNTVAYGLQFAVAIALVIVLQRQRGVRKNFVRFNFRKFNPAMVLWGIVLVFVSGVVIEPVVALFPAKYLDLINQAIGTGGWAILTTVVLAPILEEILFRGLLLEPIREKSGATRAVLISALIFGLIHIFPQQVVNAFVVGIILGFIYVRTGSLVNVILIHAVNNGLAYLQMELLGDTAVATTTRDMIGSDTWYWIIYALCVVLLGLSLYGIMKSLRKTRTAEEAVAAEKSAESVPQNDNNSN
jgi:membrane protease YdiL (CAAX protease family)